MSETLQPIIGSGNSGEFVLKSQKLATNEGFAHVSKTWYDVGTMSYQEGKELLANSRSQTEDFMATLSEMRPAVTTNGKFCFRYKDGREFVPTEHCLNQASIWARCGCWLPQQLAYNDERVNDTQDAETLVKIMSNGFRFVNPDKKFLFRTRTDGTLRAMMSDKYAILNNEWLLDSIARIIPGGRLSHWNRCDGVDTIWGNVLIPDSLRAEDDSDYGGGVSIGNSEIGVRQLSSCPWLFRAICKNGCVWGKISGKAYYRVHRGRSIDLNLEFQKLKDNITLQIPLIPEHLEGLKRLNAYTWASDSERPLFAQVAKIVHLSKKEATKLLSAYATEPRKSAFGLVQAITRAGQEMPQTKWFELDSFAGRLIQSADKLWDEIIRKANSLTAHEVDEVFSLIAA
jgi:hypothetical protein